MEIPLLAHFERWIIEKGGAAIMRERILLWTDRYNAADAELSKLKQEISILSEKLIVSTRDKEAIQSKAKPIACNNK